MRLHDFITSISSVHLEAQSNGEETRTYKITARPEFLDQLEKFFGLVERNGSVGHSALCGMYVDGDGSDHPKFSKKSKDFEVITKGSYPNDVEVAK